MKGSCEEIDVGGLGSFPNKEQGKEINVWKI
jgi:hypothetical protein